MNVQTIEAGRGASRYWSDLWRYRELSYFLAWRDVAVRYKQTAVGVAWAFLQPALTVAVFTVVFGRIAKLPSHGVPYPILVLAGLLPWQFFSRALSDSSASLVGNANLITKIYFPRLMIPISSVAAGLVDFVLSLVILIGVMLWYGYPFDVRLLTLPLWMLIAALVVLGPGMWVAALNVKYRDFRYIIPFVLQMGIYVSPVGFLTDIVPARWRMLYAWNPAVGVIDGFRWAVTGGRLPLDGAVTALSLAVGAVLLVSGVWYFRRTERTFADVI
jgi:lipopolysaccharide transport system permease protein